MANKAPYSIADQIALLKQRGMLFKDEQSAHHFLENISYYRLKGYWWNMLYDFTLHILKPVTY
jgi:abortive infection bacteriophage resistance protein